MDGISFLILQGNTMSEDEYYCLECSAVLHDDYEPQMCCGGRECGCMGMPTNPPFCHDRPCYERYSQSNVLKSSLSRENKFFKE